MGLPTALLLARSGITVYGYDNDTQKINNLKKGIIPFKEKGLLKLIKESKDNFIPTETIRPSEIFILALPTPLNNEKNCDTSFVTSAVNTVCSVLKDGNLVVLESTVVPGTTLELVKPILDKTGKEFLLSYVSEKAIPGNTIQEMQKNHRIIGGMDEKSANRTKRLYEHFVTAPIHLTDCTTAETVKLLENIYRDVNIALANELAIRLPKFGVNTWEAIRLANFHPRVHLHQPGPGVGGHCIPIDPWFLINKNTNLIRKARQINYTMPIIVSEMVEQITKEETNPRVVLLGIAYKGNVDDDRESPSYKIKKQLEKKGMTVQLYDPLVRDNSQKTARLEKITTGTDCLVLITDHELFKDLNPNQFKNMRTKKIVDTRNTLNHQEWKNSGFEVQVLGM